MEIPMLLRDLALALFVALGAGLLALRLRQPTLVGYLAGGMLIGPHGLGIVSDEAAIAHLAEIGVVLLMFALGVEFSLAQFRPIRWLVLIGGGLFIGLTGAGTAGTLALLGQPIGRDLLLGFILALSSTIVVMRLLLDRQEVESAHGKIMLGWLVLQDVAVVPMLIALPFLADPAGGLGWPLAAALGKVTLFLLAMYFVGARLLPPVLRRVADLQHKELFFLAVLGLMVATAGASGALGLSLALGAFLAGIVISESDESRQVLAEVLPVRDLFVTLFFVSIGMLVDLRFVASHLAVIALLVVVIVVCKALLGIFIARVMRLSLRSSLLIGLGLAQIGEFSFVLAEEGTRAGLLSEGLFSLLLAAALVTMLLTPALLRAADPLARLAARWLRLDHEPGHAAEAVGPGAPACCDHVVIVGFGRVGEPLGGILHARGTPVLVIDLDRRLLERLKSEGYYTLYGDAAMSEVLAHAGLDMARLLILTLPDPGTARIALAQARAIRPDLEVVARVHRADDIALFKALGADEVIQPEFEAGVALVRATLARLEWPVHLIQDQIAELRRRHLQGGVPSGAEPL